MAPIGRKIIKEVCRFCLQKEVWWDKDFRRSFCHNCNRDKRGAHVRITGESV